MRLTAGELSCLRGGRLVFRDIGFVLGPGEVLQLTGSNGSGKSTLLRVVCGLLAPAGGAVTLEGAGEEDVVADHCHYLGHDNALKPSMPAEANLRFWRSVFGPTGSDAATALATIGLGHIADLPAGYLSAGQKRRLALARLLVSRRFLWLLDEPTAALDAASESLFGRLVEAHVAAGGAVIAATHVPLPFSATQRIDLSQRPAAG